MNFTAYQIQIATLINNQVVEIAKTGKTVEEQDEAIINIFPDYMDGFKHLIDSLGTDGINQLCDEFPGFYRFAKMMERIAEGCRDGLFNDIVSKA